MSIALALTYASNNRHHPTPSQHAQPAAHRLAEQTKAAATLPAMSFAPAEPRQLIIPKLGLQAPIESVGQNDKGEMASPDSATSVGWYRRGYLPGSIGNAVLAGHYIHTSGKGAFYALDRLAPGDEILLHTAESVQKYTVTASRILADTESDLQAVFGASRYANLNLITCSGSWDEGTHRYSHRLVVFSRFQSEEL